MKILWVKVGSWILAPFVVPCCDFRQAVMHKSRRLLSLDCFVHCVRNDHKWSLGVMCWSKNVQMINRVSVVIFRSGIENWSRSGMKLALKLCVAIQAQLSPIKPCEMAIRNAPVLRDTIDMKITCFGGDLVDLDLEDSKDYNSWSLSHPLASSKWIPFENR